MSGKKTYEKILEVAYELFSTQGYEKTSMAMIAKALGISKPALYYHFQNKEELFEKLYGFIVDLVISGYKLPNTIHTSEEFRNYMLESGYATIQYLVKNPSFSKIMLQYMLLGIRNEGIGKLTHKLELKTHHHIKSQVELGIELGAIAPENKEASIELLKMIDQSLLEKSDVLSQDELNAIWKLFIDRII